MKIKLYQVNMDRDEAGVCFQPLDDKPVNSAVYDCVYSGELDCNSLEAVYAALNHNQPEDYFARSLSVSDVVQVVEGEAPGFYFCDSVGFRQVEFDPALTQGEATISVLLVQPGKAPRMVETADQLPALQKLVGGYIEEYMPFDDPVAIICNEDGKCMGLPLNRAIRDSEGRIMDIIAGDFFLCYAPPEAERFCSLPDNLAKKYAGMFRDPERFARMGGEIVTIPDRPGREKNGGRGAR